MIHIIVLHSIVIWKLGQTTAPKGPELNQRIVPCQT